MSSIQNTINTIKAFIQALEDSTTNSLVTISHPHHEIHSGDMFADSGQETLGSGSSTELLFITPDTDKYAHMLVRARSTGEANYTLYEDTTVSANGVACSIFNRDRNSLNTPTMQCFDGPTITDDGTLLHEEHFGAGQLTSGESRDESEIVLKRNTKYLVRLTSEAAGNDVSRIVEWYEHTNI